MLANLLDSALFEAAAPNQRWVVGTSTEFVIGLSGKTHTFGRPSSSTCSSNGIVVTSQLRQRRSTNRHLKHPRSLEMALKRRLPGFGSA